MQAHISSKIFFALTILCFAFSGCTNLAPVRTFADQTKQLTKAFDPMLTGSSSSCVEKYKRKKLLTSIQFDPVDAESKAKALCGPIDTDNKVIADLNALLEQYADTLANLADEKLPTYKSELDGLEASLLKAKDPSTQQNLFDPQKLAAINSLTELLSKVATLHMQKKAIRELINHEEAINATVDALNEYASLNYQAWLEDEKREIKILRESLDQRSDKETLAANYQKTLLLTEERQIEARSQAVDAFIKSINALKKSNSELRNKFDHMENEELIKQINNFAKEVSNLRKKIKEAF